MVITQGPKLGITCKKAFWSVRLPPNYFRPYSPAESCPKLRTLGKYMNSWWSKLQSFDKEIKKRAYLMITKVYPLAVRSFFFRDSGDWGPQGRVRAHLRPPANWNLLKCLFNLRLRKCCLSVFVVNWLARHPTTEQKRPKKLSQPRLQFKPTLSVCTQKRSFQFVLQSVKSTSQSQLNRQEQPIWAIGSQAQLYWYTYLYTLTAYICIYVHVYTYL